MPKVAKKTVKEVNPKLMDKEIKSNNSQIKETKNCNCQPLPNWVKCLMVALIIATFIMMCFCLHYLWKLSDIWQAVKKIK